MRRLCFAQLLASAFAVGGCTSSPSVGVARSAIINGDTDDSDTAVVLLQAHVPGATEAHLCSGSLVSPHVIMTAAHCVDPATVGAGATFLVFDGTTASSGSQPSEFHSVSEVHYDMQFNPDKNVFPTQGHDIAVAILPGTLAGVMPLRYNHAPIPQALVGSAATIVGYGVTSGTDTNASTAGTRRSAPTKLNSVNSVLLNFEDGTHNICEGDSGGPAFMTVAGVQTIVGLTAFGDASCGTNTPGSDTRIDTWASFVDQYVTEFDPPARTNLADGESCTGDLECANKICAQIGSTSFCSSICDPGGTSICPSGMVCADLDDNTMCAPSSLATMAKVGGCDIAAHAASTNALSLLLLAIALSLVLSRRRVTR